MNESQRNGLPYVIVLLWVSCSVVIAPLLAGAAGLGLPPERKTPHEIATDIARHSRQALKGVLPASSQQGQKRDGVFLLLSFSMPE